MKVCLIPTNTCNLLLLLLPHCWCFLLGGKSVWLATDIPGPAGKGVIEVGEASLPQLCWVCDLRQVNFPSLGIRFFASKMREMLVRNKALEYNSLHRGRRAGAQGTWLPLKGQPWKLLPNLREGWMGWEVWRAAHSHLIPAPSSGPTDKRQPF